MIRHTMNPDPCSRSMLGHYCQREGRAWVCKYCGQTIKTYTGPSILDEAVEMTEGK